MKEVLFILLNQFADWEAAPLAAAINQSADFCVKTVSSHKQPIKSIGGFTVIPDYDLKEALQTDFAGVILIGGKSWRSEAAKNVITLVEKAIVNNAVLGAICDATVYLGAIGLLDKIDHTSNTLEDLQAYAGKNYVGAAHYKAKQTARDGRIITANGSAALEFAKEVLQTLGAMTPEEAEHWYRFYKYGYYAEK